MLPDSVIPKALSRGPLRGFDPENRPQSTRIYMRIVARAAEVKTNVGARTLEGKRQPERNRGHVQLEVACNGATHPQKAIRY
jgi:hypothetical protein